MELDKAREIAESMIVKYCPDFAFEFSNTRTILGQCNYKKKLIRLSDPYTILNNEESVKETIIHEIAHALTKGEKHNHIWKSKVLELGGKHIKSTCDNKSVICPRKSYIYICPCCKSRVYRHRKIIRSMSCSKCCNKYNDGKYDKKYNLEYVGLAY